MGRHVMFFTLISCVLLAPCSIRAEDKKVGNADAIEKAVEVKHDGKTKTVKPVATVNFNEVFGLSFESLADLGQRIDRSRRLRDPVGLMAASMELSAMEKVSSKFAEIKSADLQKEAISLAKLRRDSNELKAVGALTKDEKASYELVALADTAEKEEKKAEAAAKSGERSKAIGTLFVVNEKEFNVIVEVNGRDYIAGALNTTPIYLGQLPGQVTEIKVGWYMNGQLRVLGPFLVDQTFPSYRFTVNYNSY
jgi:hypothetical protein